MLSRLFSQRYSAAILQKIRTGFLITNVLQKGRFSVNSWNHCDCDCTPTMGSELALDDRLNLITRNLQV